MQVDCLQVLASEVNIGYEDIVNTQVRQVNGKPVRNLSDLTKKIESCTDQYLKFDLEYDQVTLAACCVGMGLLSFCCWQILDPVLVQYNCWMLHMAQSALERWNAIAAN